MYKRLVFACLLFVVALILSGIPQDAYRASKEPVNDRMRYFNYLQTARWYGVPTALEKYGIEPAQK